MRFAVMWIAFVGMLVGVVFGVRSLARWSKTQGEKDDLDDDDGEEFADEDDEDLGDDEDDEEEDEDDEDDEDLADDEEEEDDQWDDDEDEDATENSFIQVWRQQGRSNEIHVHYHYHAPPPEPTILYEVQPAKRIWTSYDVGISAKVLGGLLAVIGVFVFCGGAPQVGLIMFAAGLVTIWVGGIIEVA